jgi:adenylate cyclase
VKADDVIEWVLTEGPLCKAFDQVLDGLVPRMGEAGLPMLRVWHTSLTLHPQVEGKGALWQDGQAEAMSAPHGFLRALPQSEADSPPVRILGGEHEYRVRLDPHVPQKGLLEDMRLAGGTDYWIGAGVAGAAPASAADAPSGAGSVTSMTSWTTNVEGGWSEEDLGDLRRIHQALSVVLGLVSQKDMASSLLRAYLGKDAGERVLAGNVERGDVETLHAAIAFTDLRGFTEISERLPPSEILSWLNDAFDAQVGPIEKHGGHVLQFIGDGLLAIFRDEGDDGKRACGAALKAMLKIEEVMTATNQRRSKNGLEIIRHGAALHFGDVNYGNFGSTERLAFTVNGPAVNRAARMEQVGAELDRRPVMSPEFAERCGASVEHVLTRDVKGVSGLEIWGLK